MKANMHTVTGLTGNIGAGGPFHGRELRLTIGMIVKNEEKNLDKCLSSLKPLLEAVPSELIITDTGSTDRTVEIAQKYTDHIIPFEWCDDFSAARNTGLDAARGEWFLYLDGDEWFDDVTELVDFFNSGECDRYGSASYIQRNYHSADGSKFSDFHVCRIFRIGPDIRFQNKIHEDFIIVPPTKILGTYVNHYGYFYRNGDEEAKKRTRNLKMLREELQKNPEDLKALEQICNELLSEDGEAAAEYAMRGMQAVKKDVVSYSWNNYIRFVIDYVHAEFRLKHYRTVLDEVEKIVASGAKTEVFHLELYRLAQMSAYQLKQYEAAVKYGDLYLDAYEDYVQGKLDRSLLIYLRSSFDYGQANAGAQIMNGWAFLELGRTREALVCLERLLLSCGNSIQDGSLLLCFGIADKMGDWSIVVKFYNRLLPYHDYNELHSFIAYTNNYYFNYPSSQEPMMRAFADSEGDSTWLQLCRLRLAEIEGDGKRAAAIMDSLCKQDESWDSDYADILWYAVKDEANLVPFLSHVDADDIPAVADVMQATHGDYSTVLCEYFESFSFENAKVLSFASSLLGRAVVSHNVKENPDLYRKVIVAYLENLSKFVRAAYRSEILTEAGLSVLPRSCRFGFYAGLALEAKRMDDDAAYLENLRLGLKEFPAMKDCVDFLLNDFEEEKKKHDEQAAEFSGLAKQVKRNIEQLIAQGDLKQAGAYTLQLAKLIPEDDDIRRYRKLTHTEPTMAELASHLPQ